MKSNLIFDKAYKDWLADIKARVRNAQIKAALKVNTELLDLYWWLGGDIVEKQKKSKWGDSPLLRLGKDLMAEFPDMKGFSDRNLKYIRQWYLFYSKGEVIGEVIGQQVVAQIKQIPWGHNIAIISKSRSIEEALFYVQKTVVHSWSRSVLVHQMESGLYKREGKAISNFSLTLPKPQSDLAHQTLKDPYIFDFLSMSADYNERDQPTIGLLLCKNKDKLVAEYALSDIHKPIGVSEYRLSHSLPKSLKSSLPTIEEIEKEFSKDIDKAKK